MYIGYVWENIKLDQSITLRVESCENKIADRAVLFGSVHTYKLL